MISFLTLKSTNIEKTADVFRALGVAFISEQHGDGPVHLASVNSDLVLEIYPGQATRSEGLLIGLEVENLPEAERACRHMGVSILRPPAQNGPVCRMIVSTPEGAEIFVQQSTFSGAQRKS